MNQHKRKRGVVTKWIPARKYGFIAPHDGSGDVLAHVSHIRHAPAELPLLVEGEEVEFTVKQGPRRPLCGSHHSQPAFRQSNG